jgi:hypothetical protein
MKVIKENGRRMRICTTMEGIVTAAKNRANKGVMEDESK